MLVLCGVSVASLPLEAVIPAAAAAGFDAISVLDRMHRNAVVHRGLTNDDLRELLADHGIRVTDVEAAGDWLGPAPVAAERWLNPVYSTDELLDAGEALGATTLAAMHFGAPASVEVAAEAFAALCDRAAARGL